MHTVVGRIGRRPCCPMPSGPAARSDSVAADRRRIVAGQGRNPAHATTRVAWGRDSTDARRGRGYPQVARLVPRTLLTRFWDSADATPGYPKDSTDETNSLELIPFD